MRRPVNVPPARIADGDQEHAERGVGPAQDYACPIGTPVYAPFDTERMVRWGGDNSPGGLSLTGYAPNGDSWTVQHLSHQGFLSTAREGQQVANSGDTGTSTTGPHVHAHFTINGVRINPENALAQLASLPEPQPFPETKEDDDMARLFTISVPDEKGNQVYWSVNLDAHTKAIIRNGEQLDFRRSLGIPEHTNQAPQLLDGLNRIA
jgi:hypothetical protein